MKVLSIDTSSNICSVAILENTNLIKEFNLNDGLTHSEKLMPLIEKVLLETNLKLADIDLLVCDRGPGSFTGIRIGTSTVMAFADSLGISAIGVSSLEALAYNVKTDGVICSLIDAKNSNCYFGLYKLENNNYTLLEDLLAAHIDDILNILTKYNNKPITFVGNGSICNKDLITSVIDNCKFAKVNDLSAYNLGLAGLSKFLNKNFEDVLPLYLRKSQAERMLEDKNNANK